MKVCKNGNTVERGNGSTGSYSRIIGRNLLAPPPTKKEMHLNVYPERNWLINMEPTYLETVLTLNHSVSKDF